MKLNNTIFQKFLFVVVFFLCLQFSGTVYAQEDTDESTGKNNKADVSLVVADSSGTPLPGVQIVVGEGSIHAKTDAQGSASFKAASSDVVTISLNGYEKEVVSVDLIQKYHTVKLRSAKLLMSDDDNVALPFMTLKKRYMTGGESVLTGDKLEKYPSYDLRNAFSGLATGLDVTEKYGTTGMSSEENMGIYDANEKVSMSMRGRNPMWIIDDVPADITEIQLDPQEIESVTFLKDVVAKTMFGPQAADGAIFIKTKRGIKNERILNFTLESGVGTIDRMPEFVSGADYARLNNQARINSGMSALYTDADIAAYAQNNPYDMIHPSINFKDYMLKNTKSFQKASVFSQGGNNTVQYFANLNYVGDGDIYKIGPLANFNRISTRENIDVKVNDFIKVKLDFYGALNTQNSANYDPGNVDVYQFDKVLSDIKSVSPIAFPVYANNDPSLQLPWYGVSSNFPDNPVGRLLGQGYYTETTRTGNIAFTFEYDFKNLIKGLTSKTSMDYQTLNVVRIGKSLDYDAYYVTPENVAGVDTFSLTFDRSAVSASDESKLHDYYYHRVMAYETLNFDRTFGAHAIQSAMTFYLAKSVYDQIEEPRRLLSGIWSASYGYKDKYIFHGVANYSGTSSFQKDKRSILSPAAGIAWVISEEGFMQGIKAINYLKFRADAGKLAYEGFTAPFLFNTVYAYNTGGVKFGPAPTVQYFGSNEDKTGFRTYQTRIGNPDLTWETRKEYSFGLDALLLNRSLSLEATYYNNTREGQITQLTNVIPYTSGLSNALPYFNYNSTQYYGVELGLQFTNKIGQLGYSIGGNATIQNSKVIKIDEPNYRFDYQSNVGRPVDRYIGLVYLGQFASDNETTTVPQLYDATLHAGDFKYQDLNGDGVVDDNDKTMVGHTTPRLVYAVNAKVKFKGFELTVVGIGKANYDVALTNQYFWNGWGDNNYSKFVLEHNGGTYPTLTYTKVNNNYVSSSYWLTSGNFFKIKNVELAYEVPDKQCRIIRAKGIRLFVQGTNLLTVTKLKDVDPENINAGITSYPLFKTYTGGIKLTF